MPALSTAEEQLLEVGDDLKSTADDRVFPVLLESILWALYSVLIILHCIKCRKDTRSARGLFVISLWLYVLCTTSWALDVSLMWSDLYQFLPSRLSPAGTSISAVEASHEINGKMILVRGLCSAVIFVFCDVVALWRVYVIYGRPRWLRAGAITIFVLSSALYILLGIFGSAHVLLDPPAFVIRFNEEPWASTALQFLALSSTVCAHGVSTALITRKAWMHRRRIQNVIAAHGNGSSLKPFKQVAVLYIVIESGIVYTSLWVVYMVTGWFSVSGNHWSDLWMCQISGMYPTLVIIVVMLRDSLLEESATVVSEPIGASISIRYATDNDVEVDVTACRKYLPLSP